MSNKVVIYTILPVLFLLAPITYIDFNLKNFILLGSPIILHFLINLYLDFTGISERSDKAKGYSGYFALLITSIFLLIPSISVYKDSSIRWIFILIWLIVAVLSFVKREVVADSITSGPKQNKIFKIFYFGSIIAVIILGGGGYYPSSSRLAERLGNFALVYFSYIFFFFSLWLLTFTQASTAKFTKFKDPGVNKNG
jgi:small-conductance mechanosensitive channel